MTRTTEIARRASVIACALALGAFYASRRNLFVGVITGMLVLIALGGALP
jgi:hypothetical protein